VNQVNLHQHSEGSFLDGLANVADIAKRARELGSSAVAVTDHNECNQHFAFQRACRSEGIKPLLGIEADWVYDVEWTRKNLKYPSNRSHICMIAENNVGLSNIWSLSSLAYTKKYRYYKPLLTLDLMKSYREGVLASDGCMITEFSRAVEADDEDLARQHFSSLLNVFGDRFYCELHTWQFMDADTPAKKRLNDLMGRINRMKVRMATEMGVPMVVVNDAHHVRPEDWENKELIWKFSVAKGSKGDDQDGEGDEYGQKADHLMGSKELYGWMERHGVSASVVDEAIRNSQSIAERCDAEITKTLEMPRLNRTEREDLRQLIEACEVGFRDKVTRAGLPEELYYNRLREELHLISDKGFSGYFNVEKDLVDACVSGRWNNLVNGDSRRVPMLLGPGRGSAGGCLVAYLLGITAIDPIHYGLLFERFLDPDREDNPDIDVDFPQSMRPDAKRYLESRYGHDHVCTIEILNRSKPKQILKDLGRALKINLSDVVQMSKIIEQVKAVTQEAEEEDADWEEILRAKGGELSQWAQKYPTLFTKINEMQGIVRQSGRHPSGVLVSNRPVLGTVPTRTRDGLQDAITQFDMHEVEQMGACKLDLLGLRHLDTLMHARNLVHERHGVWLDFRSDDLPVQMRGGRGPASPQSAKAFTYEDYADPAIWPQIAEGNTVGIFQLETPDLTRHSVLMKPRSEREVAALISIVRPGVKDAGLGDVFLNRHSGKSGVEYDHPLLEGITKETHGVLVYQEQLMATVKKLAGFTAGEANSLRRALGKKKMDAVVSYREKFTEGCLANEEFLRGYSGDRRVIDTIWKSIEASGRYAFNQSHAVGYATISTWEVWVKHYYPIEFIAALLATDPDNVTRYVREARRMGFKILPPDINRSSRHFTLGPVGSNEIRYGLGAVRGLASRTCDDIDQARPYRDFPDYLSRSGRGSNKTAVWNLVVIGAFDGMADRDTVMDMWEWERAKEGLSPSTLADEEKCVAAVARRFENSPDKYLIDRPDFNDVEVMGRIEKELCGSYILSDPMLPYASVARHHCDLNADDINGFPAGKEFPLAGQAISIKVHSLVRGNGEMAFLGIQSWKGYELEVTVPPSVWPEVRTMVAVDAPLLLDLVKTARGCQVKQVFRMDWLRKGSRERE